jgi:hypothetical protein
MEPRGPCRVVQRALCFGSIGAHVTAVLVEVTLVTAFVL